MAQIQSDVKEGWFFRSKLHYFHGLMSKDLVLLLCSSNQECGEKEWVGRRLERKLKERVGGKSQGSQSGNDLFELDTVLRD